MVTIETIMEYACESGASDIHLTVGVPPKMRVNGAIIDMPFPGLTGEDTLGFSVQIMNRAQHATFEEEGEFDMSATFEGLGRCRVNVFRQRGSVGLVLRVITSIIPSPESLGLPPSVVDVYQRKRGLILVTGPTGSGKSTTLAALIDKVNEHRDAHIVTLEDPIEYLHTHKKSIVNQREIGMDTKSYAKALRSALREDPDVILVGEMRDLETISIAIRAAETGHLVLSTLHTIGAASTVDRIIDVFPENQQQQIRIQLANVLEAVISQQLIPTADGMGRVAAFEVLHATYPARNLIRENKTYQLPNVMQTSRSLGMITMDDAIFQLYLDGIIDHDNAIVFAQSPEAMQQKIG